MLTLFKVPLILTAQRTYARLLGQRMTSRPARLWRAAIGLVAVISSLVACSGNAPSTPGGGTRFVARPPNPITVIEQPDRGKAKSAVIGSGGGSITATGSDGVMYTLSLSKGSVPMDTLITVQPVQSVGTLPFSGGRLAAVHLLPEGLQLLGDADLSITGVPTSWTGPKVGFEYRQAGSEFHLTLLDSTKGLAIHPDSLAAYGIVGASPSEISAQESQHPPTSATAQIDQTLAAELALHRVIALSYERDPSTQAITQARNATAAVVDAEINQALQPNAAFSTIVKAMVDLLGLRHFEELSGENTGGITDAKFTRLKVALAKLYVREVIQCFASDMLAAARALWIYYFFIRWNVLTNDQSVAAPDPEALSRCLTFKLSFTTSQSGYQTAKHIDDISTAVEADGAQFSWDPLTTGWNRGSAMLHYVQYRYRSPITQSCPTSFSTEVISELVALGLGGFEVVDVKGDGNTTLANFYLGMTPGEAREQVRIQCPFASISETLVRQDYNNFWAYLHQGEHYEGSDGTFWVISQWALGSGKTFATKSYDRTVPWTEVAEPVYREATESTRLILTHAPVGSPPNPPSS